MVSVTVKFYGLWRDYLGADSLSLDADDVAQAVAQVEGKFGSQLRAQLQARGIQADREIQDYCLLLLSGRNVAKQKLQQVKLRAGDVLHILPLVAGG